MPPPCICLFQPRLLFPYDDYRGSLRSVAVICLGLCMEVLCLFLCFLWAVVCVHHSSPPQHWALLPLPLIAFDSLVFSSGLSCFLRSYAWLLPSEKSLRVILLLGLCSRLILSVLFSLLMIGVVPLGALVMVSAASYATGTFLNMRRNDVYTWARLQCWDLVVLLQLATLWLQSAGSPFPKSLSLFFENAFACTWPLWVFAAGHLCCCLLLGLLLLRDTVLQQNTITRVLVHFSELHAVAFLLSVVAFSQWLSVHLNSRFVVFVSSGVASFFLLMLFAAFVSICFMANHTRSFADDVEQRGPSQGGGTFVLPSSSAAAAAAAAAVGPPLMCDMKLTLERVSEHFYRIGGPLEDPFQAPAPHDKGYQHPGCSPPEQGPLEDGSWPLLSGEGAGDSSATRRQEDTEDPQRTEAAAGAGAAPLAEVAAAAPTSETVVAVQPATPTAAATDAAAGEHDGASQREAELCIICCNTVSCLYTCDTLLLPYL